MIPNRIRVLIVDDSAFARKVIREVLSSDSDFEVVGIARDGLEALEKISELRPDVVTLDLLMPDLDGLGVLRALGKKSMPPIVIVSISASDSELAIEALAIGAVDLVSKPTALATDRLFDLSKELIAKVKAAATARPRFLDRESFKPVSKTIPNRPEIQTLLTKLVVVGTSTGGPQALTQLFSALPGGLPVPIAIALHIPAGYTAPLAARISKGSLVKLEEARDGMELLPGQAVISPGGMHLRIRTDRGGSIFAVVSREPNSSLYRPSVDQLFESAAKQVGSGVIGVVLTGMGNDGLCGAQAIRIAGGRVIAESASSCVVFGMPRSVIEAGAANAQAPLGDLAQLLVSSIQKT